MKIAGDLDYRNSRAVLASTAPGILEEIFEILSDSRNNLDFTKRGRQRNLSKQIQSWFVARGWRREAPSFTIPDMRYDLLKGQLPPEIELGHQRLVFPDFVEFLADYSKGEISCGVMIVTGDPLKFGNDWHCSLDSTTRKIEAIREVFLVPVLVLAVNP